MATEKNTRLTALFVILAVVVGGLGTYFLLGNDGTELSVTGAIIDDVTGELIGPWAQTLVNYEILTVDKFTGADVIATLKVFDEQPEDWNNARGDFSNAVDYTAYTSASGVGSIDREMPGTYFIVMTASGYNTEFMSITIPDGFNRGDLSDYQSNPDAKPAEFSLIGATTDTDFAFTLANATAKTVKGTVLLTTNDNTEFRGWKVIVNDEEGFSVNTDGDAVYDEGISKMSITVGTKTVVVFESNKGTDKFDSNDEYSFDLSDILSDGEDLAVKVEITANTGDYVGANDEVWGEGEGVLSYIKVYDAEANLFATVDVTA